MPVQKMKNNARLAEGFAGDVSMAYTSGSACVVTASDAGERVKIRIRGIGRMTQMKELQNFFGNLVKHNNKSKVKK